jgi:DNA-binding response OmpR family regulator
MPEQAPNTRALLIEDDPNIVDLIRSNLAVRGFDTVVSTDGMRALQLLETEEPDIVLLDLTLPEADGFDLCRQIRERSTVAVIVVSARGGERDKVTALNMGADDYMTKPFSMRELIARVHALLRRAERSAEAPLQPVVRIGDVELDATTRRVRVAGELVHLTPIEFDLAYYLAARPGRVSTREELLAQVWGYDVPSGARTVDSHIRTVRRKLGPTIVRTVHGVGYAIEEERACT